MVNGWVWKLGHRDLEGPGGMDRFAGLDDEGKGCGFISPESSPPQNTGG